jgi:hypothetical protein
MEAEGQFDFIGYDGCSPIALPGKAYLFPVSAHLYSGQSRQQLEKMAYLAGLARLLGQ